MPTPNSMPRKAGGDDDEYPDGGSYGKLCNRDGCVARHVSKSGWCKLHDPRNTQLADQLRQKGFAK